MCGATEDDVMKAKDVIKGVEEGFDDNEQISDAVEWVEDAANRLAEFEQDNHMQAIKIEKLQAELAALKAQNADLLKALQNLTENVVFYHRNGISDLKDAKADRNNAVKIALIAIGIEADPDLEFSDWQPSPAIAKARGDL